MFPEHLNNIDMKTLLKLLLFIPLLFMACENAELPVLTVSENSIEVPAEASSAKISLSSNNPWTVTAPDWLTVTPSKGEGDESEVKIQVKENDTYAERKGAVVFKSGELSATVNVIQAANLGIVLPETEYKISSAAQQLEVTVRANVQYDVEIDVDWITQIEAKSLETTTLFFEIDENTTYDPRQGIINIVSEDGSDDISIEVNQVPMDAILVSPTEFDLTCEEHLLELEVQTNVELEVLIPDAAKDWVSYVETKALEKKVVTLKVSANSGYEMRSCEVEIRKKDGDCSETVFITQAESKGLEVAEKEFSITPEAQTVEIKFQANAPVVCDIDEKGMEWISVVETKALEDGTITLSIKENTTYDVRESNVYIRLERTNSVETIKISQKQKDAMFVDQDTYEVPKEGQDITVTVKTTMEYDVEVKDAWITEVQTKSLDTKTHTFTVSGNEEVQGRSGQVVFKSKTTEHTATVTVNQAGSGGYIWYNGIVASASVPGKGTESDPYIINTANDLQWLIDQAGSSTENDIKTAGKYYKLTHDIEIDSDEGRGWTPIGMGTNDSYLYGTSDIFSGYFDGGGHTITGKMVPVSQLSDSGNLYFGFFGFCKAFNESGYNSTPYDYLPTIKNLKMSATVIVPSVSADLKKAYIGALVGYSHTAIEIAGCTNSGVVTGFDASGEDKAVYMAGLMGLSEYNVTITDCENIGDIKGGTATGKSWTAGVVGGATNTTAKNVSNKGKIYGAAGYNSKTGGVFAETSVLLLENVNNYATVYGGNSDYSVYTGGVAAEVNYSYSGKSYIKNCHNSAEIFGGDAPVTPDLRDNAYKYIGGLFGWASNIDEIRDCSNSGNVNSKVINLHPEYAPEDHVGGLFGANFSNVYDCNNSGDIYVERSGSIGGLAGASAAGDIFTRSVNTGDVTLVDCCFMSEVGGITGTTQELLSECTNKGSIKVSESDSYEIPGTICIGGIAGESDSGIDKHILNCTNEGKVEVLTPFTYSVFCGGILGRQASGVVGQSIKGCKNMGDIIGNDAIKGNAYTAGIVALTNLTWVENCVNTASVTGGIGLTQDSYMEATAAGGIVAMLELGKVFNSCENAGIVKYNDANVTKNLGSAVGYLYNIYDEEDYSSVVCTCTKDTSGQGLPVIGGGYKEPIEQTQCSICTSH